MKIHICILFEKDQNINFKEPFHREFMNVLRFVKAINFANTAFSVRYMTNMVCRM